MLQPCLKIWKLELIFGRVAITLPGVRSPLSRLLENDCAVCTRPKGHLISEGLWCHRFNQGTNDFFKGFLP
jgi:hypothetical protein